MTGKHPMMTKVYKILCCSLLVSIMSSIVCSVTYAAEKSESQGQIPQAIFTEDGSGYEKELEPRNIGVLAPGKSFDIGSFHAAAGQKITISLTYTPVEASLYYGYNKPGGLHVYLTAIGGSAFHTFTVDTYGAESIYLYNPSQYNVTYEVSYNVE